MWNLIKKLFGGTKKEQKMEEVREQEPKVIYVYPRSDVRVRSKEEILGPRRQPRAEGVSMKEWLQNCREVDAMMGRLASGY